jgi:NADH-quinone oxidoreductase subunit L
MALNSILGLLAEAPTESGLHPVNYNFFEPGSELWSLSILIPLLPYLAAFIILFVGAKKANENLNHNISIAANAGSFAIALVLFLLQFVEFFTNSKMHTINLTFLDWAPPLVSNGWTISIGFLIDPLSTIMFTLVSFLALLIQIYGKSYMHGEKGIKSGRYNAEISLFVGSMLLLALSANHLIFFIGWEIMGLCSYLLIGFFLDKDVKDGKEVKNAPASAAKKAFIVTKIGDILLMAGFSLIFYFMVTIPDAKPLDFIFIREHIGAIPDQWRNIIAFLLFGGAVGKSAQFPLHIWLPDAMEGPTTVSALIHSATMVKAGVFLVARNFYIFEGTDALLFVGLIGSFTAIFAATMAFVADDIKRVLAYSTISQLGYMFLGLGAGSLTGGMFHLISHSFFKCLLFLSAGSLIHAVHSNDMWKMGGLREKMKWTYRMMLFGSLGLSGIIFFNGFYSKDAVISAAGIKYFETGDLIYGWMFIAGLLTALMTGFYTFRMIFTVFHGECRYDHEHVHPHESPSLMRNPLIILGSIVLITGILSTEGYLTNLFEGLGIMTGFNLLGNLNIFNEHTLDHLLESWVLLAETTTEIPEASKFFFKVLLPFIALSLAGLGILFAFLMYTPKGALKSFPKAFNSSPIGRGMSHILIQKYYMDHFYVGMAHFIRDGFAEFIRLIDSGIDSIVDGIGRLTSDACGIAKSIDEKYVDGTVQKLSNGTFAIGRWLRRQQTGVLQNYNQQLVIGLITIMIVILTYFYIYPNFL